MNTLIYKELGNGIYCIDAQYVRTGLASCYMIEENGHAVFIDVGTNHTTPLLMELLKKKNIPLDKVDYVIPTHVHLDHAGGAGSLMQKATKAQLIIHPRGARHMIDPSRLQAGASAVYGKSEFKKHYGDLIAIPKERVTSADDGFSIDFQGRELLFMDTPGHAKHHFCIIDKTSNGMFTGDTFGVAYPELTVDGIPFIFPPSSPVDFNPLDWLQSVDKLMASGCTQAYLTHFGMVNNLPSLAQTLKERIQLFADIAQASKNQAELAQRISQFFTEEISATGCPLTKEAVLEVLAIDIDLVAQGLSIWIEKNN